MDNLKTEYISPSYLIKKKKKVCMCELIHVSPDDSALVLVKQYKWSVCSTCEARHTGGTD